MLAFCRAAIAGVTIALLVSPAAATDVCTVQASRDGFVVLREQPSPMSAELARAKPGEALVIQKTETGELIERGHWIKVFYYPGEIIPEATDPEYKHGRVGWMHRSFVGDCG